MKKWMFLLLVTFVGLATSCSEDNEMPNIIEKPAEKPVDEASKTRWERNREAYRVDRIEYATSIQSLSTEYFYDADHRLIKQTLDGRLENTNEFLSEIYYTKRTCDFQYENEQVSRIITRGHERNDYRGYDYDYQQETVFQYNTLGQQMRENREFVYDRQGRLISTYAYYLGPVFYQDSIVYDDSGNVVKHIMPGPESNMIEEPIIGSYREIVCEYEYDQHPKPNFGLGDFISLGYGHPDYEPLPYVTLGNLARSLSKNNMTKAVRERNEWVYTYNEKGLPATMQTIWTDIPTSEPMTITISYKKIEARE